MTNICVFCASSFPKNERILADCLELGRILVKSGCTLVYGGAHVGIMGKIAEIFLKEKGKVVGIMPELLTNREIASTELTEKFIVNSMAERKALMNDKAEAFVVLPGGIGTLDEFSEVVCLSSLGQVRKPIVVLNSCGYFDYLLKFMEHAWDEALLPLPINRYLTVVNSPSEVMSALENFSLPPVPSWIKN